jgi:electron transport complex protein RnfC
MATALSRAGLAGLGGAAFPTGVKLGATWRRPMRAVVVNGAECEPYISCDDMLMRAAPYEVVAGAIALVELTGAEKGFIALEEDTPEAQQALESAIRLLDADARLSLVTVPCIYPAGGERQLIQALTGHEVPSLAHPTDIGYLCQNVGTAAALYRFLRSGEPLICRVTTVTGSGLKEPRNLEVRFGTKVSDLIDLCGGYTAPVSRLIMGGSMMGIPLHSDSVPVTRTTNCIIAMTEPDLAVPKRALQCIGCGDCATVCPAYLMPQELHRAVDQKLFDALEPLGLFDCIECGCCDVVCPSHIPLTESFRTGKQKFLQAMNHDDRVRWFDAREQRKQDGIHRWEERHGQSEDERIESPPSKQRLEHVAEVIGRLGRLLETADP